MQTSRPDLQVLLPVYNEADCIGGTLAEIYAELSPRLAVEFIICEDGSRDGTREILRDLAARYPMRLILSETRKGYSRAVLDGMRVVGAPYLLCLDSDGQCDPADFWPFWEARGAADVLVGWRTRRQDTPLRKFLSRTFYHFYRLLIPVPLHDPSCPFMLARKEVIAGLIDRLGRMDQGFWWEFAAQAYLSGLRFRELPIHHRLRSAGVTKVYQVRKMLGIGVRHGLALLQIRFAGRGKPPV